MPDIFDFVTTRQDITPPNIGDFNVTNNDLNIVTDLQLLPTTSPSIEETNKAIFDQVAMNLNKKSGTEPLYTYGIKEARRYDEPGKQFTPGKLITGGDIEDLYSKNQSFGEKLLNGTLKGFANAGGTFVNSFLSIPATIDLIRQGKYVEAFHDDTMFAGVNNWLEGMEDKLPNYYSEWEREHPYLSMIPFSGGAANFWADKIVKNMGFSIGALGAGLVQDAAIEYATMGTATPVVFINLARQMERFGFNLFRGFRNMSKVLQEVNGVDNLISTARITGNFIDAANQGAKISRVANAARFATTSYLSAQGEAFIEGYQTYVRTKKELYERALNGELSDDQLATMEQTAQDAARWTTGVNMILLSLSNAIQFPKLLGGKALYDQFPEGFIKAGMKEGLKFESAYTTKKMLSYVGKEVGKDFITEGSEEGVQYITGNSLHDYYLDRFDKNTRDGMLEKIQKQFNDPELYQEFVIGGLSGFLQGGIHTVKSAYGLKDRTETVVNHLNTLSDRFNSTASLLTNARKSTSLYESQKESIKLKDGKLQQYGDTIDTNGHGAFKNLYNLVESAKRYGTYDVLMDTLQDAKELRVEEYNKMFNTDFTSENQKLDHINKIVEMANSISDNILMVDSLYKRNPYTSSNILVNKIKNAFSPKTDLEFEKHAEFFFNEFKTALAYNYAKVQFLDPKLKDIKRSFQAFGFKDESIDYLIHTVHHGDYKTVKRYVDYKQTQLDALKKEKRYLETMLNNFPSTTPLEGASKQDFKVQLKNVEDNIDRLEKLIKEVDDTAKNLPKRKEDEDEDVKNKRQELLNRIIFEEVSPEQAERYKKNKDELEKTKDKLQHAANTEEEIENLKKEQEDPTSTQEGIIDAAEENIKETTPDFEEAPNPPIDPASWMNSFFLTDRIKIKGVIFNIVDKLKTTKPAGEPALVLENEGKKYGLVKRGEKFYIIRTEGLDRIGINKKEAEVTIELLQPGMQKGFSDKVKIGLEDTKKIIEMAKKSKNPILATLARLLEENFAILDVPTILTNIIDKPIDEYSSVTEGLSYVEGYILTLEEGKGDADILHRTLHELMHQITQFNIEAYYGRVKKQLTAEEKDAITNLIKLYESTKQRLSQNPQIDVESIYGLKNVSEFIAESFTNQEFQKILSDLPSESNPKLSVFEELWNTIKSFFKVESSVLEDIFFHVEKMSHKPNVLNEVKNARIKEIEEESTSKEKQVLENENFRLSEETYSLEDIKKYPDRYFVKADQDISLSEFSLYFWKDNLLITKIKKGNIETVRSGKAKVNEVKKTPITEFREIIFKDKLSIKDQQEQEQEKQESKKTEIDNTIKEFLGSSFTEDKARSIKTAVEKGLIEIEC